MQQNSEFSIFRNEFDLMSFMVLRRGSIMNVKFSHKFCSTLCLVILLFNFLTAGLKDQRSLYMGLSLCMYLCSPRLH